MDVKMNILWNAYTDTGKAKNINQDAACVKRAESPIGSIVIAVICDGIDGLDKGELASSTVVRAFISWFDYQLPIIIENGMENQKKDVWKLVIKEVKEDWKRLIQEINGRIMEYGKEKKCRLGTTATALFILDEHCFLILHIGDSRIYLVRNKIKQLTRDHTVAALEAAQGKISKEEAKQDPRKYALLQCVGLAEEIAPDIMIDTVKKGDVFLLCTDGFYNKNSPSKLFDVFYSVELKDREIISKKIKEICEQNKEAGETDNMTAVALTIDI